MNINTGNDMSPNYNRKVDPRAIDEVVDLIDTILNTSDQTQTPVFKEQEIEIKKKKNIDIPVKSIFGEKNKFLELVEKYGDLPSEISTHSSEETVDDETTMTESESDNDDILTILQNIVAKKKDLNVITKKKSYDSDDLRGVADSQFIECYGDMPPVKSTVPTERMKLKLKELEERVKQIKRTKKQDEIENEDMIIKDDSVRIRNDDEIMIAISLIIHHISVVIIRIISSFFSKIESFFRIIFDTVNVETLENDKVIDIVWNRCVNCNDMTQRRQMIISFFKNNGIKVDPSDLYNMDYEKFRSLCK